MQFVDMETVKKIMTEKGITVKELAMRMEKTSKTVRKYLNGADQSKMRMRFLYNLVKALDVPARCIYTEEFKAEIERLNALYGKK